MNLSKAIETNLLSKEGALAIDILGTPWKVILTTEKKDSRLKGSNGICDPSVKEILIEVDTPEDDLTVNDIEFEKARVIRHEIIHAFLYESGLNTNCSFAMSEEMVDWLAIQFYKLDQAFARTSILRGIKYDTKEK